VGKEKLKSENMDFIPLIFVCGTRRSTKPLGQSRSCPNCGTKNGAQLYQVNKQEKKACSNWRLSWSSLCPLLRSSYSRFLPSFSFCRFPTADVQSVPLLFPPIM